MKKIIILFLFQLVSMAYVSFGQDYGSDLVGFSCSITGKPTLLVTKMTKLAVNSNYKGLKTLLLYGNDGERYLSAALCEALQARNIIVFTQAEKNCIEKLYHSDAVVPICSGCTVFKQVSMSQLLNGISDDQIDTLTRKWAKILSEQKS
tara:strand:+ start:1648 stop:2094 length:447 start_codon:yes stop_codon:yes gene_type:complete